MIRMRRVRLLVLKDYIIEKEVEGDRFSSLYKESFKNGSVLANLGLNYDDSVKEGNSCLNHDGKANHTGEETNKENVTTEANPIVSLYRITTKQEQARNSNPLKKREKNEKPEVSRWDTQYKETYLNTITPTKGNAIPEKRHTKQGNGLSNAIFNRNLFNTEYQEHFTTETRDFYEKEKLDQTKPLYQTNVVHFTGNNKKNGFLSGYSGFVPNELKDDSVIN